MFTLTVRDPTVPGFSSYWYAVLSVAMGNTPVGVLRGWPLAVITRLPPEVVYTRTRAFCQYTFPSTVGLSANVKLPFFSHGVDDDPGAFALPSWQA